MAQSAQIKKVNAWHERLCDWLIANPGKKQKEAAQFFGVSESWLSTVIHSDAFQDYFRTRSDAASAAIIHSVKEKMLGAADQAVSELQRRLEFAQSFTTQELLDISDVMTKRSMPAQVAQQPGIQQLHLHMVPKAALAEARAAMRSAQRLDDVLEVPAIANERDLELEAIEVVPDGEDR